MLVNWSGVIAPAYARGCMHVYTSSVDRRVQSSDRSGRSSVIGHGDAGQRQPRLGPERLRERHLQRAVKQRTTSISHAGTRPGLLQAGPCSEKYVGPLIYEYPVAPPPPTAFTHNSATLGTLDTLTVYEASAPHSIVSFIP